MANSSDRKGAAWLARFYLAESASATVGCHYLWGAAGAKPGPNGGSGGAKYRPGSVTFEPNEIDDPKKVMIWAASCSVQKKRICCGRYKKIEGGREANPGDWDLNNYLAQLRKMRAAGQPQQAWPDFWYHFTPRWAEWIDDNGVWQRRLLWGEDCGDIQHFDCIGFINYWLGDTRLLNGSNHELKWYQDNLEDVSNQEPWPLDILIRRAKPTHDHPDPEPHHIGFVFGINGESAVSALESVSGVVAEKYQCGNATTGYTSGTSDSGAWSKRVRLSDYQVA